MFGAKVTEDQATSAIEMDVFASIRSDWPTALSAVNLGQSIGDLKPNSAIPKDIAILISKLMTDDAANQDDASLKVAS